MTPTKLSDKQQVFVNEYLVCWNATKAAIAAGYSEATAYSQGGRLLKNVEIADTIQTRIRELTMRADEALMRLSDHARGNLGDFMRADYDELSEHPQSHLLKKVKRTVRTDKDGEKYETVELELYDAQAALVHILKEQHLKSGEATEITDDVGITDTDRAARIATLLERARTRRDGQPDS